MIHISIKLIQIGRPFNLIITWRSALPLVLNLVSKHQFKVSKRSKLWAIACDHLICFLHLFILCVNWIWIHIHLSQRVPLVYIKKVLVITIDFRGCMNLYSNASWLKHWTCLGSLIDCCFLASLLWLFASQFPKSNLSFSRANCDTRYCIVNCSVLGEGWCFLRHFVPTYKTIVWPILYLKAWFRFDRFFV